MHLALSHPEVAFIFLNNGQEKLRTSGSGKLKDVIYNVYGRDVAANLLDIDYEKRWTEDYRISRKARDHQRKPQL